MPFAEPCGVARLSANLTWLFTGMPLLERIARARAAGFTAVEALFPYETPAAETAAALAHHGLSLVLINTPPGDTERGERGLAAIPGAQARFRAALDEALAYAATCGCTRIHAMAGNRADGVALAVQEDVFVTNLREAAPRCADAGVTLTIEPLNAVDNPGYVLGSIDRALALLERIDVPNVRLQLDLYHAAMSGDDPAARVRALAGRYAHVQIGGVPGRHEPDAGTVDGPALLAALDAIGYAGYVGLEYAPRTTAEAGLGWAAAHVGGAPR